MLPRFFVPAISWMVVCGSVAAQPQSPARSESDQPKTESPAHTNRLAKESSPYLLQHAHNPVDWYPWGEEALQKARREDKMIFLSVGYSACHWCHVMERESFQDPEIARILNERFVCVKVDREERPDVDQIYMTAVQIVSRRAGWPMSVFLLPDARPFWGGSYFPARDGDRENATGFLSIMNQVDTAWRTKRSDVEQQAEALTEAVKSIQLSAEDMATVELEGALVDGVVRALLGQYDPEYGGFGGGSTGPKFPEPSNLIFLLDRASRPTVTPAQRDSAKRMLIKTLDGMISGAMYDHLGGGFHRYSVDRRWQIPHFEKMLYDNAQLASVYAAAYRDTQRDEYRHILEGICDFVIRELQGPGGAFFSALDADSEGEEGKFYRWTEEELKSLESVQSFRRASVVYRLGGKPNFEGAFFVPDPGESLTEVARRLGVDFSSLQERLGPARNAMLEVRSRRVRPMTDTKILTAWNGLMIAGLADAGRTLERKDYTKAAVKAALFLVQNLRDKEGRLSRSFAGGKATLNAYLDDYAFLVSGLIALHRSTGDPGMLTLAHELSDKQIELFWDEVDGGFYFTSKDHPSLIVRLKDPVDGAIPSGTSVSAENLLYLARQTKDQSYQQRLERTLQSLVPMMRRAPSTAPRAAAVLAEYLDASGDP